MGTSNGASSLQRWPVSRGGARPFTQAPWHASPGQWWLPTELCAEELWQPQEEWPLALCQLFLTIVFLLFGLFTQEEDQGTQEKEGSGSAHAPGRGVP